VCGGPERQQGHHAGEESREIADALKVGDVGWLEREQDGVGEVVLQLRDGAAPVAGRVEADEEPSGADGGAGWVEVSPQPDVGDRSFAGRDRGIGVARADDQAAYHPQPPGCAGGGDQDRLADPLAKRTHGDASKRDFVRFGGSATVDDGRQELALAGRQ
jgi:hypothetical protein